MSEDHLILDDAAIRAINREGERIQSELCCLKHPFWGVLCSRKIGHEGQHYFMTRWVDEPSAAADVRQALRELIEGTEAP